MEFGQDFYDLRRAGGKDHGAKWNQYCVLNKGASFSQKIMLIW